MEQEMVATAEAIVGRVGDGNKIHLAVTGEEYVSFSMTGTSKDEIIKKWKCLVNCYKEFSRYVKSKDRFDLEERVEPTLYWRFTPEITLHDGKIKVYARMLISTYKPKYAIND